MDDLIDMFKVIQIFLLISFIGMLCLLAGVLVDQYYKRPIAQDIANNYYKSIGFDQFKSFTRVGLLSTEPVGITCEYAERYTDLGIRTN